MLTPFIRDRWRNNFLQSLEEFAPCQQHTPVTSGTAYANIRPDAIDHPLIAAARVWFFHLYTVTHIDVLIHSKCPLSFLILTVLASLML